MQDGLAGSSPRLNILDMSQTVQVVRIPYPPSSSPLLWVTLSSLPSAFYINAHACTYRPAHACTVNPAAVCMSLRLVSHIPAHACTCLHRCSSSSLQRTSIAHVCTCLHRCSSSSLQRTSIAHPCTSLHIQILQQQFAKDWHRVANNQAFFFNAHACTYRYSGSSLQRTGTAWQTNLVCESSSQGSFLLVLTRTIWRVSWPRWVRC